MPNIVLKGPTVPSAVTEEFTQAVREHFFGKDGIDPATDEVATDGKVKRTLEGAFVTLCKDIWKDRESGKAANAARKTKDDQVDAVNMETP